MNNILANFSAVLFFIFANTAHAAEEQWFVAVYGEQHEPITGASSTSAIIDGEFLANDFVGKEIYVRIQQDYSLLQYAPKTTSVSPIGSAVAAKESAIAANSTKQTPQPISEFELVDSGLTIYVNEDFKGWYCSRLHVTPLGNKEFKLRCNEEMQQQ
jgi:hypothetical protein